jgi:hypothetical protein
MDADGPGREGEIASLAGLKERLGDGDTILCLGNGPSSEDPRLAAFPRAMLFRVNWIWLPRGFLAAPDAVFTADPDLVRLPKPPVVLFPTAAIGRPILAAHAAEGHHPAGGHAFLDRFAPRLADFSRPQYPTNGALMIALAAALAPRRMVIAGIDLYRHPAGKYPGGADNEEGYTAQHRAELDLALIGQSLDAFRGEALILSDNLRLALGR